MGGKLNVYERLMEEFKRLIDLGALKYGEKLPSCRALATERGINPNTVERAYSELEAEGYIHILPKKGAYVEKGGDGRRSEEIRKQLRLFRTAGATKEEVLLLLEEAYAEGEEPKEEV